MTAHAALRSLLQILDDVLRPGRGRRIYHNRAQVISLYEKVSFLLDFLEHRKHNDMELECVETKIRDAAYEARFVTDTIISNMLLQVLPKAVDNFLLALSLVVFINFEMTYITFNRLACAWMYFFIVIVAIPVASCSSSQFEAVCCAATLFISYVIILVLTMDLSCCIFWEVMAHLIQVFVRVINAFLIYVQFLLPVSFQGVLFVMARILNSVMLYSIEDIFVPSMVAAASGFLIDWGDLDVTSFARYWLYAFQPENLYLCRAIADFHVLMKEAIKIEDTCCIGPNLERHRADGLSRGDLGGIGKTVVVGLDGELNVIFDVLLGDQPERQVVSIVGMGGIGKTTLAKQVHDDPHIVCHFDLCVWITVTQKYSFRHVMLGLLGSAKIRAEEILQKHEESDDLLDQRLGELLRKNLMRRRYLIVMDDVWDKKVWDFVSIFLPDNSNGSRVLLTTRVLEVATYPYPCSTSIQMQFLNDDDSWDLLRDKVFGGECCPPELEAIGRTIARNCKGLPLAIVVVGGLIYNEHRTVQDWDRVSNNLNSIITKDDMQCLGILGLSYKHLPHRLKPCFLYMGSFHEDEEIHVTRLFNLWAAEGFLEASKSKTSEEVAEEYLKDLVQRSLIMVGKWSCNGKIKTCRIHDLIRDLCWLNASKENFLYFYDWGPDNNGAGTWEIVRTLFDSNASDESRCSYVMARSFLYAGRIFDDLSHIFSHLRLLRVLDVVPANLQEFPDEIFKLVHLRYLGVTYNYCLPLAISQLWNLETIVYHGRRFGSSLLIPFEIWCLPNLRHLYFKGDLLPDPPSLMFQFLWDCGALENLQTLVGISNFRCTKHILKSIPHLKKLGISYHDSSFVECELESLVNLHQLQALKITMQSVLNPPKLGFPQKLKKLSLSGCRLPWEWMTAVGALPDLRVLKLRNYACEGRIWEPVEGEFCELMFLLVEDTDLEEWRADEAHFPRLKRLVLRRCHELKEIPPDIGEISTLERIELADCHPDAVASARFIQEEQQSMGNEDLKIHIQG